MLKKLLIGLAILAGLTGSVHGAGTVPGFSLTPQFDATGKVMPGCKLYTIQAGTTSTPQSSYQDSGLTILQPNPLLCDSAGRLPQWFVADGSIKVRLTTSTGTQVFVGDNLLVIGASSGGGGGSPVDPTTIIATGDMKARYGTGVLTGFVRANGRTIGSATSGATERANADCQSLFEYLWGADANLAVSGGRGASANADWVANKTLALPDWRGRALAFLDDMGNSAAGRLTSTYFGTAATVLGAAGGSQSHTLTASESAALTYTSTTTGTASNLQFSGSTTNIVMPVNSGGLTIAAFGAGSSLGLTNGGTLSMQLNATTATSSNAGGAPFAIASPMMLATIYLKL